jgi:hypothetical protein
MKRSFTLLLFTLLTAASFAGFNDGKITITQLGIQTIRVEIDGKVQANRDRLIMIDNLAPGYHTVKVYSQSRSNGGDRRNDNWDSKKSQLIYSGKIRLKPNYHVDIVINRFGKVLVDERQMDSRYRVEYGEDKDYAYFYDYRDNDNDHRYDNRNNDNDRRYDNRNDNDDRRYDNRNSDRDRQNYNNADDIRRRAEPMQDQAFASLTETLKRESFESTRLKLARQVTEQHYFTSAQVRSLLQLFTFEESRLDLAKYMYGITIDRENYFQLYNVFTYSASKEELAAYMSAYK